MKAAQHSRLTSASRQVWHVLSLHVPLTVVLASLPLMLLAAAVVYLLWEQQQSQFRLQQEATARTVAASIDKEIAGTIGQLEYMASSPALDRPTLRSFVDDARRALTVTRHWSNLIVFSADGRVLLNARFPEADGTPPDLPHHVKAASAAGEPMVSDLYFDAAAAREVIAVIVPVLREERAGRALAALLELDTLDELVREGAYGGGVVSILDRERQFVSRSISPQASRGLQPAGALAAATQAAREGRGRYALLEGGEAFTAWTPVGDTGWTVTVSVPVSIVDALLYRHLWMLALAEGLILLMVLPVAHRLGREAQARAQAQAERDRLFEREREARDAAERANRAKDEFLAMLGHELRNPLAAVSNAVHLLDMDRVTPEGTAFARAVIARQSAHLTRLIDDLLDVGRAISGKIHLQRELIDLAGVAKSAVNTIRAAGKAGSHRLTMDAASVYVEGDRTRLEQVIVNLLANALSYTPAGGSVHIAVRRRRGQAVLVVRDDGVGLRPEELERVFELFYQAQGALHRQGGLGIGLTLVRRLVELHGGTISVASEGSGKGAEFTVCLPAVDSPAVEMVVTPTIARRNGGRAILLIEDNDDARESLARLLTLEGHKVFEAPDGLSGVETALRVNPDIALIDIGLPHMDGYEVARTLRARGSGMTLVALTGYGQPEDERRAHEAGFDAHLVKPADPDRLREVIMTAG
jgi:signal transduction histidine kinase